MCQYQMATVSTSMLTPATKLHPEQRLAQHVLSQKFFGAKAPAFYGAHSCKVLAAPDSSLSSLLAIT